MGGEPPTICSQCGYKLGPSEEEIGHPEDPDPPDDPHFKVQIRDDGEERLQCRETGRLAAPAGPGDDNIGGDNLSFVELYRKHHGENPPGMGEPDRGEGQQSDVADRQQRKPGGIYDVQEEKNQMDLIKEVITNPRYGLNDDHIAEVREWAEDMDGRLPPGTLEDILKNLSGIQKQTAQLIRQRYELKLNKWMRDQSQGDEGPSIGVSTQPMPQQRGSSPPSRRPTPTPQGNNKNRNQKEEEKARTKEGRQVRERQRSSPDSLREFRRTRRTKRRQEVLDITAQRAAEQAADQIAAEFVQNFGTYFGLPAKILEAKIEKDPDWAIEKAEQLDIDIFDLMEPSEQRKKEMGQDDSAQGPQVDNEVDSALEEIRQGGEPEPRETTESNKPPTTEQETASPMSASPDNNGFTPEPEEPPLDEEDDSREGAELFD